MSEEMKLPEMPAPVAETESVKAEAEDTNESTLVKKAKELQKAISMCRIGTNRRKLALLTEAMSTCEDIVRWDERNNVQQNCDVACRDNRYPLR